LGASRRKLGELTPHAPSPSPRTPTLSLAYSLTRSVIAAASPRHRHHCHTTWWLPPLRSSSPPLGSPPPPLRWSPPPRDATASGCRLRRARPHPPLLTAAASHCYNQLFARWSSTPSMLCSKSLELLEDLSPLSCFKFSCLSCFKFSCRRIGVHDC
jgi:hypothetical protein